MQIKRIARYNTHILIPGIYENHKQNKKKKKKTKKKRKNKNNNNTKKTKPNDNLK